MTLNDHRNKYKFSIPKGMAEKVIQHKHANSFYVFLELKPLFSSSVIFNEDGKFPYKKICEFLKIGNSTLRNHFRILKKYKLIKFNCRKDLCLAKYQKLEIILHHKVKYKLKTENNGDIQFLLKQIAIYENLKRQKHELDRKISESEFSDYILDRNPNPFIGLSLQQARERIKKFGCRNFLSRGEYKCMKKYISENMDFLLIKYRKIYNAQILQLSFGFPEINPNVTLSCKGTARLFGSVSSSSGYYQQMKMLNKGLLDITKNWTPIPHNSAAIYEMEILKTRSDVFGCFFNATRKDQKEQFGRITQRGTIKKYFINECNTLRPIFSPAWVDNINDITKELELFKVSQIHKQQNAFLYRQVA